MGGIMNKNKSRGIFESIRKGMKSNVFKIFVFSFSAAISITLYRVIFIGSKTFFAKIQNIKILNKSFSDVVIDTIQLTMVQKVFWYMVPFISSLIMFTLIFYVSKAIYYKFNHKKLYFLKFISSFFSKTISDNRSIEKESKESIGMVYNKKISSYDFLIVFFVALFLSLTFMSFFVGLAQFLNDINNTDKFDLLIVIFPIITGVPLIVGRRTKK